MENTQSVSVGGSPEEGKIHSAVASEKKNKKAQKETKVSSVNEKEVKKDDNLNLEESNNNAIWKIWDIVEPYEIPETKFTIKGYSLAALRTNFYIKELGIMFDAGLSCPNIIIDYLFITHAHSDHVANIPFHIYSAKQNSPMQIFVPEESKEKIKNYIEAAYVMSSDTDDSVKREELYLYKYFSIVGVKPDQKFNLILKNKSFEIEIIKCYHSIPCVGYGLIEQRQKLKDEYKSLQGKEIGELRKKGVDIYYIQDYPLFCFLGDTNKEILKLEAIRKYRTIMIECTFILDDEKAQAEKTCHLHWNDLEPFIRENQNKTFILYHFSQRYTTKELKDFFCKSDLKNVVPWIN